MAYFSGKDGSVSFGGNNVAKVGNWSLSTTVDALEVTDLSLSDRTFTPGLRSSTGSATIFYTDDALGAKSLLDKIVKTTATAEADITTIKLGWGAKGIQSNCIITSAELNCAVGEIMQATIQFQFTGVLSLAAL